MLKNNLSKLLDYLEKNNIAFDIGSYRDAPLGIQFGRCYGKLSRYRYSIGLVRVGL